MRKPISILLFALAALLASCDDGRVEENIVTTVEGRTVKMTGNISGIDKWADGYTVALAGFKDDDVYAVVLRNLSQNETGTYDVVLPGITDQVSSVELCILNRLHQRVATIRELTDAALLRRDTIPFNVGDVDAGMFNLIQMQLFSPTCANCHGASSHAAAGLNLTEGKSYASLTDHPSVKMEGKNIVEPGSPENSVLYVALTTDVSIADGWRINHRDQVGNNDSNILQVIEDWIKNGAKE